jgi:hypothetical protein
MGLPRAGAGPLGDSTIMSTDMPGALASEAAPSATALETVDREWFATALTILFTAAAVLFVSFIAVITGLV